VWSDPPRVEFFYPAKLIRFKARSVTDYVLDGFSPPIKSARAETAAVSQLATKAHCVELKLQEE